MKEVLWEKLRRPQIEDAARAGGIVIMPVASMEQHGNHLPVNTDANCCLELAKKAAQALDEFPLLVLPPIWTGYSPHHMTYLGSITLKYHTFVELLTQVATSVHAHGFKKILFLNGHGGNSAIVAAMRLKLAAEEGFSCMAINYWDLPSVSEQIKKVSQSDKGFIGHAGEIETSLQLYLQPELVDQGAATWAPGVWGDPSTGTKGEGERIVKAVVDALVKYLLEYHSGILEDRLVWRKEVV